MKSKKVLLNTAEWLLHGTFKRRIESQLHFTIEEELQTYSDMIRKELSNIEVYQDVYLKTKIFNRVTHLSRVHSNLINCYRFVCHTSLNNLVQD
jgi:two-component sensor histidine kinase